MNRASALVVLLLSACGATTGDDNVSPMDASPSDAGEIEVADSGGPEVEVGTGVDFFEPLQTGDTVPIILGPQGGGRWGGFHVWHAVRTRGFDPSGVTLRFKTYLASTREELASQERRVNLQPSAGAFVAYGIAPPFMDCCQAENAEIIMAVTVVDAGGRSGEDERTVRATVCREANGLSVCP